MNIKLAPVVPTESTVTLTLTVDELYVIRKALALCPPFSLEMTNGETCSDSQAYGGLADAFTARLESGYFDAIWTF